MKENVYDKALDRVLARLDSVSDRIGRNFKGVKPFDKEPIQKRNMLQYYEMLNAEDMRYLVKQHGEEAMNEFVFEMETERKKVMGGGNA